jgi:cytochrome c-type biogenesis protein CcmE
LEGGYFIHHDGKSITFGMTHCNHFDTLARKGLPDRSRKGRELWRRVRRIKQEDFRADSILTQHDKRGTPREGVGAHSASR